MTAHAIGTRFASPPVHAIEVRWDVRIPVRDGLQLSANLWLPSPAAGGPDARFPALLEMIPYGKDTWHRASDVAMGEFLAARGCAFCRLDVRGTGSSPGIALDEYTADETNDGYDAVEWLAAQPWCNGAVAMWGVSYGGFTAIQVAALRPPHLRAIVPVYATDDRYTDDVHYHGGCALVSDLSQYAVSQVAMNAMPPDRAFRGDAWRDEWLDRLERTPPWILEKLRHQVDGPYWRRGSLAPGYDRIEAAIFCVGGWMDEYVDAALRMQARCSAPRRTLVGNWVHSMPDAAYPGPRLDWLHELVRFLDHWLKGVEDGVMEEPGLAWFAREWTTPEPFPTTLNGRWRAASSFPVEGVEPWALLLAGGDLPGSGRLILPPSGPVAAGDALPARESGPAAAGVVAQLRHRPAAGTAGSFGWGAGHPPNGLARDLRPDEAQAVAWTSPPLAEPLEIIGFPAAVLHVTADAPVAHLVVRLADVAPDGTSAQVSVGMLNLTHRDSDEQPEPLEPGRRYEVRVPLRGAGYRWLAGHRLRLSVASAWWPAIWPSPRPCTIEIHAGPDSPSRVELPVLPAAVGARLPDPPAWKEPPTGLAQLDCGTSLEPEWRIEEDVLARTVTVRSFEGGTTVHPDGQRSLYSDERLEMTAHLDHPARARFGSEVVYRWDDGTALTEIHATGDIRGTATHFEVRLGLEVVHDGAPFWSRTWEESIPRDLV
ncbi:MAG: CocE/NonD family hydrolase [Chloroflexi bacterium]|nr:CocE/NonD family hydrolase [Chloroflexota bacterium]